MSYHVRAVEVVEIQYPGQAATVEETILYTGAADNAEEACWAYCEAYVHAFASPVLPARLLRALPDAEACCDDE